MRRLAKSEAGFGLVELLISMTVMVIAIMAIVAAFSSGMLALDRASRASTAATLADIQVEGFRRITWASIAPGCVSGAETACSSSVTTPPGPPLPPDGRTYRIDTAVQFQCVVGTLSTPPSPATCGTGFPPPVKLVTVVVYDPTTTPATELFRESSTFAQATGS